MYMCECVEGGGGDGGEGEGKNERASWKFQKKAFWVLYSPCLIRNEGIRSNHMRYLDIDTNFKDVIRLCKEYATVDK